ncbi:hypothetical protein HNP37_000751 [Flavobacterium nitrogenifigens]|uniref:DUF1254 domain-containing protein n=2 Tax=Flavobacterium TaxID=237 RepID=A0A7W7IV33_9FLAO|nr:MULTISPECIES: DUF1254 domain-containing protein [Flavobacterium]MBB4800712.1 hypothetical protein [Flavobacterium nitrogenifigens]MBB6385541.1 hypothetical protein [Flavobacterium notoginsengisoli]
MKKLLFLALVFVAIFSCKKKETEDIKVTTTTSITQYPDSAKAIAKEAWTYAFSMAMNYRTMHLYALDKTYSDYAGGFNKFRHYDKIFTAADTAVVTPNNDTPYSWATLNLKDEPVVLEVPAIKDRYYSFQFVDLYTYNFAYIGSRTTGDKAGKYLIAGPDWKGEKPAGIMEVIQSETYLVTLLGRTELKMASGDIENVKKIQAQYKLMPFHEFTKTAAPPHKDFALPFAGFDRADLGSSKFIGLTNNLLQYTSPNPVEKDLLAKFARIGIVSGKEFDPKSYTPEVLKAIDEGVQEASKELEDGANKLTNATFLFGTRQDLNGNYTNRALGAAAGLFGNTKEEAIYIGTRTDKDKNILSGQNKYIIRFPKGQTPPAQYFWSITLYNLPSRYLVENPINRYSIGDRTSGLKYEPNGDLIIYIQNEAPKGKESNWLPAPKEAFYYLIRVYGPKESLISGAWKAPQPELVK